ncbi:hypothetical protein VKT23_004876 [Stygiomarasmius scandens]|uniref:Uncharacterized protein n=1 Tax=Marasmiellus scandens TaxID=2682957 RepID=A0ABR1JSD1_9AGAR
MLIVALLEFGEGDFTPSLPTSSAPRSWTKSSVYWVSHPRAQALTNKTSYVSLSTQQSPAQRDSFVGDLYVILFAFVVETANHKMAPSSKAASPHSQIVILNLPGYYSRGLPAFYLRHAFEDTAGYSGRIVGDGLSLPANSTMENPPVSSCSKVLFLKNSNANLAASLNKAASSFKSGKVDDHYNEDMLQGSAAEFGVHASFVTSPEVGAASDLVEGEEPVEGSAIR